MRVEIRPSVAADFLALQGQLPPHRTNCLTALAGGEVIAIGGFVHFPDGTVWASVLMTDAFRQYPTAVHRAGRLAMQLARRAGYPRVYAYAEPGRPGADAWIERLGFQPISVRGETIYQWERAPDHER